MIVSIIILLSTRVVLTPTEHLFPIFFLIAAINIVALAIGSKKQKILALVVLLMSLSLGIWSFQSLKHKKEMREGVQELSGQPDSHQKRRQTVTSSPINRIHRIG